MSNYEQLWKYVADSGKDKLQLSFDQVGQIGQVEIDHSFLSYKKELLQYGYQVKKISIKNRNVLFEKTDKEQENEK